MTHGRQDDDTIARKADATPTVYVVAGPNGAGKSTFATRFLPDFVDCREFLNADLIASGLSPFAPETQNVRAGRLMLERFDELAAARQSFGFETTLAGRSHANRLRELRDQGYRVVLFFLWMPSADLCVLRVANRVRQGGHSIPEGDIRRRYAAGIRNLLEPYWPLTDDLWLYNATQMPLTLVARMLGENRYIIDRNLFETIAKSVEA